MRVLQPTFITECNHMHPNCSAAASIASSKAFIAVALMTGHLNRECSQACAPLMRSDLDLSTVVMIWCRQNFLQRFT